MKKKIACIIATPYHLFNIYNILSTSQFSEYLIDIYVVDHSVMNQIDIIRNFNHIRMVYDLSSFFSRKELKNSLARSLYLFHNIYIYRLHLKKIIPVELYSILLLSYPSIPMLILYDRFKRNNKNIRLLMYEDGIGTYNKIGIFRHKITAFIYNQIFHFNFYENLTELYLYQPSLISITHNISHCKLHKIFLTRNNQYMNYYYNNYKDEIMQYQNKKVIFFDQYLMQNNRPMLDKQLFILNLISKIVGSKNVIFKIHPRASINNHIEIPSEFSRTHVPFEIIMQSIPNLNDLILISDCSTACLTPKLIIGKEPKIILLSILMTGNSPENSIFMKVRSLYKNETSISIPNNYKELESSLNKFTLNTTLYRNK